MRRRHGEPDQCAGLRRGSGAGGKTADGGGGGGGGGGSVLAAEDLDKAVGTTGTGWGQAEAREEASLRPFGIALLDVQLRRVALLS